VPFCQNTLLQTAFSAISPTGKMKEKKHMHILQWMRFRLLTH